MKSAIMCILANVRGFAEINMERQIPSSYLLPLQPSFIGQEEQPQEQDALPAFLSFTSFKISRATTRATMAKTTIVPKFCEIKFTKSMVFQKLRRFLTRSISFVFLCYFSW